MQHYLKALKRKKSPPFSVGLVMLLVLTLCLSGCSEKTKYRIKQAERIPSQISLHRQRNHPQFSM